MNMNNIIYGDDEDSSTTLPNRLDRNQSTSPIRNNCSPSEDLEEANHRDLFGSVPLDDTTMTDQPDPNPSPQDDDNVAQVCSNLQEKLELDPAHLKISLLTSKCAPEARHANSIFANAAFHQLDEAKQNGTVNHIYDEAFKTKARMFFLIPSLEAYSNNPHKNGTLARSLYYLTLDAIEKQSDDWKEEHLPPALIQETEGALGAYRNFVGVLLKYQRSHLRTLKPKGFQSRGLFLIAAVGRYAFGPKSVAAFSGKSGQKPLKTAVAQRSGPFFAAHTRSVSGVVAEFRYATLIANSNSAALRYTNRYG
ncbi:hypothetical protein PGT21_018433 [Puccinia graminis f. sp. tritici]|uniref:Uncharacterized protein n=1 Tax=Puccinia graminis f. sp. tritici TaxID=56615 RepID=A0A5B0NYP9_PUCGR|nr:hypothetical protein PGT21_018433 [Puccinia graminis f. sp. tritici]